MRRSTGVVVGALCLIYATSASAALRGNHGAVGEPAAVLAAGSSAAPADEAGSTDRRAVYRVVDTESAEGPGVREASGHGEDTDGYKVR